MRGGFCADDAPFRTQAPSKTPASEDVQMAEDAGRRGNSPAGRHRPIVQDFLKNGANKASGVAQEKIVPSAPLTVEAKEWTSVYGPEWMVPRTPQQIDFTQKAMLSPEDFSWRQWPPAAHGVAASADGVMMTVQGKTEPQVVVTGISVEVRERRPPMRGTLLDVACGDTGAVRMLEVDLDANPPRSVARFDPSLIDPDARSWERRPIKLPYKVSKTDAEVFFVSAHTKACHCTWVAHPSWMSAGRSGHLEINDHGRPFQVTARKEHATCRTDSPALTGWSCQ